MQKTARGLKLGREVGFVVLELVVWYNEQGIICICFITSVAGQIPNLNICKLQKNFMKNIKFKKMIAE